jgi:hypothetical protein
VPSRDPVRPASGPRRGSGTSPRPLRSPSPWRTPTESRPRTRVPIRAATCHLLPRVRSGKVPSSPTERTLPRACDEGLPTSPRCRGPIRFPKQGGVRSVHDGLRPRNGRAPSSGRGERRSREDDGHSRERSGGSRAAPPCWRPSRRGGSASSWRSLGGHRGIRAKVAAPSPFLGPERTGWEETSHPGRSRSDPGRVPDLPHRMTPRKGRRHSAARLPREGPVALRPSLSAGLPLSCHRRERRTIPGKSQWANRGGQKLIRGTSFVHKSLLESNLRSCRLTSTAPRGSRGRSLFSGSAGP